MSIVPYLNFPGTCREAMSLYRDVLGGTLEVMGFGDLPGAAPELVASGRVMHANLESPLGKLLASDYAPGMTELAQQAVTVSLQLDDVAVARRVFDGLAEGATVTQPFGANFFSPGFGMLTDRFGTAWMVVTSA